MKEIGIRHCSLIEMDVFYKDLTPEQLENVTTYNFDHPNALDFPLMIKCLQKIIDGDDIEVPKYDFKTCARCGVQKIGWAPVVIFEGIFAFVDEGLRRMMDLRLFINTDDDIRLARRLLRDVKERGRSLKSILLQYNTFVKKGFDEFIKSTMKYADIMIPFAKDNTIGLKFVIENIKNILKGSPTNFGLMGLLNFLDPKADQEVIKQIMAVMKITTSKESDHEVFETVRRLLAEEDMQIKKVWLSYLSQRLVRLLKTIEKPGKGKFDFAHMIRKKKAEDYIFDRSKVVVLFHYAIMKFDVVDHINSYIKKAKEEKIEKLIVLSFFSSPKYVSKIVSNSNVWICILTCNPLLEFKESLLLNSERNSRKFCATADDYEESLIDQLQMFDD